MSNKLTVFIKLKNLDLHAASALEAIREFIGYDALLKLERFRMWEIDAECETDELNSSCDSFFQSSYYFLNVNKEMYTLNDLPKSVARKDAQCFLLKVEPDHKESFDALKSILSERLSKPVHSIKHAIVWRLLVQDNGKGTDLLKRELEEQVILSTEQNKGLLVNPIYEQVSAFDTEELFRPTTESELTELKT